MCGIAGMVGTRLDPEVLRAMGDAIAHRGPDEAVVEILSSKAGYSFRRLSIIDVAGGHQPIWNEARTAAIMLNGEIYNHRELRAGLEARGHRFRTASDVEAVLHLWEEKAERCLEELRGMFALAIWDQRDRSLLLARDRLGKKPLYLHRLSDGGLLFASEIKALLQHARVPRRPDLTAIDQFLTLQYVPTPTTAFQSIERLPPASWLRWRDGQATTERYWDLDYSPKYTEPEAELTEELLRLLRDAVRVRLESEVPLGAFLSGGIDSSAVVAFAAGAVGGRLKTFSIGFEPAAFDESGYARMVARRFDTDHHELTVTEGAPEVVEDIVWHYDQPFGDSSAIPSFHVARLTKPHVTVVLNGDGGDESFAGYDRYRLARFAGYFALPRQLRSAGFAAARPAARLLGRARRLADYGPVDFAAAYHASLLHLAPRRKGALYSDLLLAAAAASSPPLAYMRGLHGRHPLDAMLDTDIHHYLPDDLLVKMDVATMASSLEGRSPLLDHRLLEFMARVPPALKLRRGHSKHILKSALRGILPAEILERPKQGFGVPLGRWLRTSLREMVLDIVLSERALGRGYFRPRAVKEMVEGHLAGHDSDTYIIWDLLMLELWHRTFIDQRPTVRPAPAGGFAHV